MFDQPTPPNPAPVEQDMCFLPACALEACQSPGWEGRPLPWLSPEPPTWDSPIFWLLRNLRELKPTSHNAYGPSPDLKPSFPPQAVQWDPKHAFYVP
jgi:hypothetical protein